MGGRVFLLGGDDFVVIVFLGAGIFFFFWGGGGEVVVVVEFDVVGGVGFDLDFEGGFRRRRGDGGGGSLLLAGTHDDAVVDEVLLGERVHHGRSVWETGGPHGCQHNNTPETWGVEGGGQGGKLSQK